MSEPYAPGPGRGYPPEARGSAPAAVRTANPVGIVAGLVGGAVALIGTLVDWYTPGSISLADIISALDAPGAKAFPKAYFDWLMWVLLALTVVTALFANTVGRLSPALRVASPVLGGLGAVLVVTSLDQLLRGQSVFEHTSAGLWLVLVGFVIAGLSGVPGPRRRRSGPGAAPRVG